MPFYFWGGGHTVLAWNPKEVLKMDDRLDRVGQPEQSPSNPLDIGAAFQEIYRSPSPKGPTLSAQAV